MLGHKAQFILTGEALGNLQKDFEQLVDQLGTFNDIHLKRDSDQMVTISYQEPSRQTVLKIHKTPKPSNDTILPPQRITLSCAEDDLIGINLVRNVIGSIGYRIFSPRIGCFLPAETNLVDVTGLELDENLQKIFAVWGFRPLFMLRGSLIFYAQNIKNNTIHLINRFLLQYFWDYGLKRELDEQFSLEVAPDIGRFIALQDRGLAPISFYKHFKKKTLLVNLSGFDSNKLETAVLIAPIFFQYDPSKQAFRQANTPVQIDKIEKGGSVEKYLEELSPGYLAAKIAGDVEFDKGRKGYLLPRLSISIFLDRS